MSAAERAVAEPHSVPGPRPGAAGRRPLLFLDFEGSSLDPGSWPIEISYAWIADGRIESRTTVIAPHPSWPLHAWSEAAAEVHGLSLRAVRAGRPADRVAAETDDFAGFAVVSTDPQWHQRWLSRLRAGRAPKLAVGCLSAAAAERLDRVAAAAFAAELDRAKPPQRAGIDARALARAWARAASIPAAAVRVA